MAGMKKRMTTQNNKIKKEKKRQILSVDSLECNTGSYWTYVTFSRESNNSLLKCYYLFLLLFQSEEPKRVRHKFRFYQFQRPRICFYCKQQIWHLGSACTVCRYVCHRKCELQVSHRQVHVSHLHTIG